MAFLWRDQTIRHALQGEAQSARGRLFTHTFLQTADTCCLLSGRERFGLESLCRACVLPRDPKTTFRKWLREEEHSPSPTPGTTKDLYREYHASRLQRSFLRRVLSAPMSYGPSVVAGSYPLHTFLQAVAAIPWDARDIDIFTADEAAFYRIRQLYVSDVLQPLGFHLQEREQLFGSNMQFAFGKSSGPLPSDDDKSNSDMDAHRVDDDATSATSAIGDATSVASNELPSRVTPEEIKCDLPAHIELYELTRGQHDGSTLIARWQHTQSAATRPVTGFQDLQETPEHLPASFQRRPYIPLVTTVLKPDSVAETPLVPAVLRAINVVLIRTQRHVDTSVQLEETVCSGFDMTQCCVTLTVTAELRCRCRGYFGGLRAACLRHIEIRATGFTHVFTQLSRIDKYLCRGFRWPKT